MAAATTINFIKFWIPVIIYAILIFLISSVPAKDIPSLMPYEDVIFHIFEYGVFALLISRACKHGLRLTAYNRRFWITLLIAIIYGLSDEFHQSFVTGRDCSLVDASYDGIGIIIANLLYR
jgi:VanZ family protein